MDHNKKIYGLFVAFVFYSLCMHLLFIGKEYPAGLVPFGWMGIYSLGIWSQMALLVYALLAGPNGFTNKLQEIYYPNFLTQGKKIGIGESVYNFFGGVAYGLLIAIPGFIFISGPILLLTVGVPAYLFTELNVFLAFPIFVAYAILLGSTAIIINSFLQSELSIHEGINNIYKEFASLVLSDRNPNTRGKSFKNWDLKSAQELYGELASFAQRSEFIFDVRAEAINSGFDHAFLKLLIAGSRLEFDQILRSNQFLFGIPNSEETRRSGLAERLAISLALYSLRMSCLHTVISNLSVNAEQLQTVLDQEEIEHQKVLKSLNPRTANDAQTMLEKIYSKVVNDPKNINAWSQLGLMITKRIEECNVYSSSVIARDFIIRIKSIVYDTISGANKNDKEPDDLICLNAIIGLDPSTEDTQ